MNIFDINKYKGEQDEMFCETFDDAISFAQYLDSIKAKNPLSYSDSYERMVQQVFEQRSDEVRNGIWIFFNDFSWNPAVQTHKYGATLYYSNFDWKENDYEFNFRLEDLFQMMKVE